MRTPLVSLAAALTLLGAGAAQCAETDVTVYETTAEFADVAADLEDAIVNRGYVVDYHGFIGDMLARTAIDVGASKPLYADAEFFQFCSAVISRSAMETALENIAYCPYVLFAYQAAAGPGTVSVGFRRLPPGEGRDAINDLLDEIAREATEK